MFEGSCFEEKRYRRPARRKGHKASKEATARCWAASSAHAFAWPFKCVAQSSMSHSFFLFIKNDNNYTCHLSTSGDQERTNEMSVKGFELSSIKFLLPYKTQSNILSFYFPGICRSLSSPFVPYWRQLLSGLPPFWCLRVLLLRSARLLLFFTLVLEEFFSILDRISENLVPDASSLCMLDCFAGMEAWVNKENQYGTHQSPHSRMTY